MGFGCPADEPARGKGDSGPTDAPGVTGEVVGSADVAVAQDVETGEEASPDLGCEYGNDESCDDGWGGHLRPLPRRRNVLVADADPLALTPSTWTWSEARNAVTFHNAAGEMSFIVAP